MMAGLALLIFFSLDYGTRQIYLRIKAWKKSAEAPSRTESEKPAGKPCHRAAHEKYHHGFAPFGQGIDVFGSTRTEYFINSAGFRDSAPRQVDLGGARPKILILGDSYAEGIGVPWPETVAGRLAAVFQPKGVEVLNAAVASYCPTLLLAKTRILFEEMGLRASLALLFVDISDIEDELRYEPNAQGGFAQVSGSRFAEATYWTRDKYFADWLEDSLEENFTLLGALSRNLRQTWRKWGSPGGTPELKRATWPEYHGPAEVVVEDGIQRAKDSLSKILVILQQHRVRPLLVIYPWLEQVDAGVVPSRAEILWTEWARQHDVPVVNLFPVFVPMGKAYEKTLCLPGDGHWNAAGHKKVAEVLIPSIEPLLFSSP